MRNTSLIRHEVLPANVSGRFRFLKANYDFVTQRRAARVELKSCGRACDPDGPTVTELEKKTASPIGSP